MTSHRREDARITGVPAEEGIDAADATEQLDEAPEDKRNFTETHPDRARQQRERHHEDTGGLP
jgi:hypothetical protein